MVAEMKYLLNSRIIRRITVALGLVTLLTLVLLFGAMPALGGDAEPRMTGAVRPTDEQWNWGEEHLLKAQHIRLNRLGLERVNVELKKHGKKSMTEEAADLAPVGAEVSGTTALEPGTSTPADTAPGVMPAGVDNSTLKYFPPIRSQGSLGSCAQFSAVYYTLTHMTAMARNWDAKNGGDQFRFSPKWTYNMVNGGSDAGSWHYDAYAIAQKHGLATWAEFPYDSNYRAWCMNPDVWLNAINVRADQTGKVTALNTDAGLSQLKQLLLNGYVLNYATYVNSWAWKTISSDPATGADDAFAGKSCAIAVNGTNGGHSMTIVGYNDDIWVDINGNGIVDTGEKGALRIANSWGTSWYESGFCWLSYQALRTPNPASASEGIFWYNEATWVTARSSYSPKMLAEFRLNHAKRNQLMMTLGTSAVGGTTPSTRWYPNKVLNLAGGPYAFDGTTTAVSATFYLDFTDLMPASPSALRYFLDTYDNLSGDIATLESFQMIDISKGTYAEYPYVPRTADLSHSYSFIDYDNGNATLPPVAAVTATPVSGALPLPVTFDAGGSYDTDGSIVSYQWGFGDGVSGSGISVAHTYISTGTYTATLTVTDDLGAKSTASAVISVTDPNVLNAPSGLTSRISGRTVTLTWSDNSSNESGFYVERAVKTGKIIGSYARVFTSSPNVISVANTVPAKGMYYYRVQAVNSSTGKTSSYSNTVTVNINK